MRSIIWLALRCQRQLTFQESCKIEIVKKYLWLATISTEISSGKVTCCKARELTQEKYIKQKGSPKYKLKNKKNHLAKEFNWRILLNLLSRL